MGFADRMFRNSEAVYQRIERGEVTDVKAELMEAQHKSSSDTPVGKADKTNKQS
ncbi:hypothetical protein [Streptomyces scopuliridis]|uniref:hypothetical protein n=1 Tax=Streptomyces scopuliridis TaxID=452529 RepID=UPI00342A5815